MKRGRGKIGLCRRGPGELFSWFFLFSSVSLPGVTRSRPLSCRGASRGPSVYALGALPSASVTVPSAEERGEGSWPLPFLQKRFSAELGTTRSLVGTPGLVLQASISGTVPGASLAECPSVPPSMVSEVSALTAVWCWRAPSRLCSWWLELAVWTLSQLLGRKAALWSQLLHGVKWVSQERRGGSGRPAEGHSREARGACG